jgi:hypothetical protein
MLLVFILNNESVHLIANAGAGNAGANYVKYYWQLGLSLCKNVLLSAVSTEAARSTICWSFFYFEIESLVSSPLD